MTIGFSLIAAIVLIAVGIGFKDLHDRAKIQRHTG